MKRRMLGASALVALTASLAGGAISQAEAPRRAHPTQSHGAPLAIVLVSRAGPQ